MVMMMMMITMVELGVGLAISFERWYLMSGDRDPCIFR